ncbi:MAG: hypothetical protein P1V21_14115 [Rhizobiaceae bacterium]|nr:hypothetical protein [Rhizobiaceae bacterium]
MNIERRIGYPFKAAELEQNLARLKEACFGCADCRGLCTALIEAMLLPDLIMAEVKN